MQDCVNSNKIKENKYKILRMSLLLGSGVDREDTFNNFEDAAREIDAMNDEVYLKNIEDKFYDTLKLEDEEKKLSVLVDYIGGRVEQRISLLSDFANVTGYDLQNLPPIKYYDKLDDYKERLGYIREYLGNTEQINVLNEEIENADKKLNEAYLNRASSEEHNKKIEDTLLDKFVAVFKTFDFFDEVNESNVEEKLNEVVYNVEDSKKSLDIFTKSFTTLSGSGISQEEEQEYFSYVENAKCAYYTYKEQEYVFRIYKLLLSKYTDYSQILYKREEINDILYERLKLRKELKISGNDSFNSVYDLLERQYEDIKRQSVDIENIEKLTGKINEKREELNKLEVENQKVEILSLLREFCIIDTYDDVNSDNDIIEENSDVSDVSNYDDELFRDEIVSNVEKVNDTSSSDLDSEKIVESDSIDVSDIIDKPIFEEDVLDNQVVLVEDAKLVDLDLIHSKANKVMKRVGEMLGIKVEDTKVVSVSNEMEEKNIFMDDTDTNVVKVSDEVKESHEEVTDNAANDNFLENPLFSNEVVEERKEESLVDNPLFTGETENDNSSLNEEPKFSFPEPNDNGEDFWFSSDTPDALNELPDLNVSNDDFFANNNVADLEFPDLGMSFPDNDMEEKI